MNDFESKNKFRETSYPIYKKIPYHIFEEGIGINGFYEVKGNVNIRKKGEGYDAAIIVEARTEAGKSGKAIFSCDAILYVNGAETNRKRLQGGDKEVEGASWCRLGAATFVLPVSGENVEVGLEAGYLLYTNGSMHGASNKPAQWVYNNVWKKLSVFMGEIRQKIITL